MSFQLVAPLGHPWVQLPPVLPLDADVLVFIAYGVVGMGLLDSVLGGDDDDEDTSGDEEGVVDGGDVMFDDDDELGGLDDMDEMDDEFGDMDDMDGGGDNAQELEQRVSELENELADVSSTMSTVRSENEQISETVEEVENNVRKLLEIYEMVTRGVNPFVDDVQGGAGGMGGGDSFGVFEDSSSPEMDEVDESISEADAESFFEDDLDEGAGDDEALDAAFEEDFDDPVSDDIGDEAFEDDIEVSDDTDSSEASDGDDGGKSFEDLKSEYESGEAEWDDEDGDGESEDSVSVDSGSDSADVNIEADDADVDFFDDDEAEVPEEPDTEPAETVESDEDTPDETGGFDFATTTVAEQASASKPYLTTLPDGYSTELIVLEWLDHLRSAASTGAALRALRYYENVGWIGPSVTRELEDVLIQMESPRNGEVKSNGGTDEDLTMNQHLTSLEYVVRLADYGEPIAVPTRTQPVGGMVNGL